MTSSSAPLPEGLAYTVALPDGSITDLALSDSENTLAVANGSRGVQLYAAADGSETLQLPDAGGGTVLSLAWNPNAVVLATGTEDGVLRVYDTAGETLLFELDGLAAEGAINTMAWNHAGTRLATGTSTGVLGIWNTSTTPYTLIQQLQADSGYIIAVDWRYDDAELATVGTNNGFRVWRTADWSQAQEGVSNTEWETTTVVAWPQFLIAGNPSTITRAVTIPDNSTGAGGFIDIRGGTGFIEQNDLWFTGALAWSPTEPIFASGGLDKTIRVWSNPGGYDVSEQLTLEAAFEVPSRIVHLVWSADSSLIIAGDSAGNIWAFSYP